LENPHCIRRPAGRQTIHRFSFEGGACGRPGESASVENKFALMRRTGSAPRRREALPIPGGRPKYQSRHLINEGREDWKMSKLKYGKL